MHATSRAAAVLAAVLLTAPARAQIVTQQFTLPANALALFCVTLNDSNGGPIVWSNLLPASDWNSSASGYIWSPSGSEYRTESRSRSGWTPGTNLLNRGDAFLLGPPTGSTVRMIGWTPAQDVTIISSISRTTLMGYPYPQSVVWTATDLAVQSPPGSTLHTRDFTGGVLRSYLKTRSGWINATSLILQAGQGFYWDSPTNMTWTENKP